MEGEAKGGAGRLLDRALMSRGASVRSAPPRGWLDAKLAAMALGFERENLLLLCTTVARLARCSAPSYSTLCLRAHELGRSVLVRCCWLCGGGRKVVDLLLSCPVVE